MTDRLLFDAPLAWKIYDHLITHPEEHKQHCWVQPVTDYTHTQIKCGTKACYAGMVAIMTAPEGTRFYTDDMALPGKDRVMSYSAYAIDALSKGTTAIYSFLTPEQETLRNQIESMFGAMNTLSYLKDQIEFLEQTYPSI